MESTLSDSLRRAIQLSGQSRYEISLAVGVAQSVLSRFVAGKRSITLETADRLASHFGLSLLPFDHRTQGARKAG
jgi:plasmid maintenance system antidote protein VapI